MTGADVLLLGSEPNDPDVMRLLICEVPAARALTRHQNHGEACVWCGERDSLAPLGGAYGWRPHGCPLCRRVRLTYLSAYVSWKRHVRDCEPCRIEWCPDGWSLALGHGIAYEVTKKPEPVHCACGCPLPLTSRRLRPYTENDVGGPRYSHTGPCRSGSDPGPAPSVAPRPEEVP
ncbi:hypothetical protein [Streptomyces sp. NPDC101455]|uniref:hypothetical protein n=1 Tax=Streptomyces sp. NPDC101455 TaxID=3366142 RepID=UPI0037FDE55A